MTDLYAFTNTFCIGARDILFSIFENIF